MLPSRQPNSTILSIATTAVTSTILGISPSTIALGARSIPLGQAYPLTLPTVYLGVYRVRRAAGAHRLVCKYPVCPKPFRYRRGISYGARIKLLPVPSTAANQFQLDPEKCSFFSQDIDFSTSLRIQVATVSGQALP
jgi:hypothetical protein